MAKHKHKITKKEMKEDKFVSTVVEGAAYARENTQNVIIVVLIFLVLIIGVVIWRSYRSNRLDAAKTKLGIAQIAYATGQFGECRDSLIALTNNYPSTESAKVGLFLLGHIYYAMESNDSAGMFWQRFLDSEFADNDLRAAAQAGLAAIMSDKGSYADAARAFERCYQEYPDYFDRGNWLYMAAQNYRAAGEIDKSKELFKKYIDENGNSPMVDRVQMILAEMEAR